MEFDTEELILVDILESLPNNFCELFFYVFQAFRVAGFEYQQRVLWKKLKIAFSAISEFLNRIVTVFSLSQF